MGYTCKVKRHSTILYRQGRELDALSHAVFVQKAPNTESSEPNYNSVCRDLNTRLHSLAVSTRESTGLLNVQQHIKSIDPVLWDMICTLTRSGSRKPVTHDDTGAVDPRDLKRLFILHQIVYCMDNTCSMPFHILTADLIDSCGGSAELVKIFNRLGVCVSFDTLLRHIQGKVEEVRCKGLLQGLDPRVLTMFTVDNIDFLHSHAQVFSGNQHLSWHGTTVQAVQPKPSLQTSACPSTRRRSHALLSPYNSPDKQCTQSPVRKKLRGRARTGTELRLNTSSADEGIHSSTYDFTSSVTFTPTQVHLTISDFRVTRSEDTHVEAFLTQVTTYMLLKNAVRDGKHLVGIQSYFTIASKTPEPEVAIVKYIQVLDEMADCKETILHVISSLYTEYIANNGNQFLVLEGDAKTYAIIQAIKHEYGSDLSWLIPYPGDCIY